MSTTTTITGKLTRDPEIRYTREGQARTSLSVQTGEEGDGCWFDVLVLGELAENVALSLIKGHKVIAVGELTQRTEHDDDDEMVRVRTELVASDVGPSLMLATADVMKVERRHVPAN